MEYISAQDAANMWGISKRRVQTLCASHRIENAVRVGNMWILPANSKKPSDGRIKHKDTVINNEKKKANPIRIARNQIKTLSTNSIKLLLSTGCSFDSAKIEMITLFASELLLHYTQSNNHSESYQFVAQLTGSQYLENEITLKIRDSIKSFILHHPFFCDDALSWCYQYINKVVENSQYSTTQFFTEKYMISTIVDSLSIKQGMKLIDPACGGGNFLLYFLDILTEKYLTSTTHPADVATVLNSFLDNIFGYEIDYCLALVSSINLRLKCLSVVSKQCGTCEIDDFNHFCPNIFYPQNCTIGGSLEYGNTTQQIKKVGSGDLTQLDDIFQDVDIIATNPPFQTVKGMPIEQKEFLKKYYPTCKCDMCNAFIELSTRILKPSGKAGLVTQNSWMYLDSFTVFRKNLLSTYIIPEIWEIGSNAFYDLNGEKTNVALMLLERKTVLPDSTIKLVSLNTLDIAQIEDILSSGTDNEIPFKIFLQTDILHNSAARFDMVSSDHLRKNLLNSTPYGSFAIPMQGTSTGDAKNLIRPFWEHLNDPEWHLVSKGGGYARWQGLNHYSVKWGKDGEYIKATKGSAIRNAQYFNETQMVFSDTGTAGLNVRELLSQQYFVASGPGIRLLYGNTFSHLAVLNSRYASYYIRLLSPKLTISAGYISKIPIVSELVFSETLSIFAQQCIALKQRRLEKRPYNIEFRYTHHDSKMRVSEAVEQWLLDDLYCEWEQLKLEQEIDNIIYHTMSLTQDDIHAIDQYLGPKIIYNDNSSGTPDFKDLSAAFVQSLDANCDLARTKATKKALGCDGIIEFLSQKFSFSCESIYYTLVNENINLQDAKMLYRDLYFHALIMSVLQFKGDHLSLPIDEIAQRSGISFSDDCCEFKNWIQTKFNSIHYDSLLKCPIFHYDRNRDMITAIGAPIYE